MEPQPLRGARGCGCGWGRTPCASVRRLWRCVVSLFVERLAKQVSSAEPAQKSRASRGQAGGRLLASRRAAAVWLASGALSAPPPATHRGERSAPAAGRGWPGGELSQTAWCALSSFCHLQPSFCHLVSVKNAALLLPNESSEVCASMRTQVRVPW